MNLITFNYVKLFLLVNLREWRGDGRSHRGPPEGKGSSSQVAKNIEDSEQTAEAYVCQKYIQDPLVVGGQLLLLIFFVGEEKGAKPQHTLHYEQAGVT